MQDLARRAVACKHWRWMPGMLGASPSSPYEMHRVISAGLGCTHLTTGRYEAGGVVDQSGPMASALLPDLTDPATLGCLLALMREALQLAAWVRDEFTFGGEFSVCWKDGPYSTAILATGNTEAEALIAALEAAP